MWFQHEVYESHSMKDIFDRCFFPTSIPTRKSCLEYNYMCFFTSMGRWDMYTCTFTNDYIHDVQLPTFHVIRQTFLTSYSSLYTSQPHQAHTCYSHAQTHTKGCIILAQCWIISFLKDYYGIYLVKWINTEVFFNCNVNIFTVSNTILYSLRIELETYFFFLIYHIWPF